MFGNLFKREDQPRAERRKKKQKVKLTRAERKRLNAAVAKVRKLGHGPGTAQETIPTSPKPSSITTSIISFLTTTKS